jgi:CO/xanthine dehydrogenase Mo-binding subunit
MNERIDKPLGMSRAAIGQPLCGSFMDYGMPRLNTLPSFTVWRAIQTAKEQHRP